MFICEIASVEANRTILNSINIDDGVAVELKSLPKFIGFDDWGQYDEIRFIQEFEIDFGVFVPVVFAVEENEVVEARVLIVEAR